MLEWILWSTMIVIFGAFLFEYSGVIQKRKDLFFNIKITKQQQEDSRFDGLIRSYKKQIKWVRILGFMATFGIFLVSSYPSFEFLYMSLYMFGYPAIEILLAIKYAKQLKKLKSEAGWRIEAERTIWVDTKMTLALETQNYFSLKFYAYVCILNFLPWLYKSELSESLHWVFIGLSWFVWALALALSIGVRKGSNKVYSENSDENVSINFKVKNLWLKIIAIIYVFQVFLNALWLRALTQIPDVLMVIFLLGIISGVVPLAVLWVGYQRQKSWLFNVSKALEMPSSEEECWIGGIFYYNPKNPKTFVNKPYSIGSTMNLATKSGKVMTLGTLIFMVLLFGFLLVHMFLNDFSDPYVVWQEDQAVIQGVGYKAVVEYDAIESIEKVDKLSGGFKTNGTATDKYARGSFKYKTYGKVTLFVFNNVSPYIYVNAGEVKVIYSARTPQETEAFYEKMIEKMEND